MFDCLSLSEKALRSLLRACRRPPATDLYGAYHFNILRSLSHKAVDVVSGMWVCGYVGRHIATAVSDGAIAVRDAFGGRGKEVEEIGMNHKRRRPSEPRGSDGAIACGLGKFSQKRPIRCLLNTLLIARWWVRRRHHTLDASDLVEREKQRRVRRRHRLRQRSRLRRIGQDSPQSVVAATFCSSTPPPLPPSLSLSIYCSLTH